MNFTVQRFTILALVLLVLISVSACSKKEEIPPAGTDALVLKNGGKIQCQIVKEDDLKLIVEYQGGRVEFLKTEIKEILRNQQLLKTGDGIETSSDRGEKEIHNYPYVRTRDGKTHYGKKLSKQGANFILEKDPSEASVNIPQDKIEKILLWPPADNQTLSRDFQKLITTNPKHVHEVDPYVIYSDVESSDFVLYRNAVETAYHRFMINFFDLIDESQKPQWGLGVILYGKYSDYTKSGGPDKTAGYYRPDDHVLRLFNMREVDMVKAALGEEEKFGDQVSQKLQGIESSNKDANSGKWKEYDFYKKLQDAVEKDRMRIEQAARSQTMETIRHEGTHQVLNLFGIDSGYRGVWFSEGMADYLSPDDPNGIVLSRIMSLKAELEDGHKLMPLDYLMSQPSGGHIYNFKDIRLTGQFYSQSWAFIHMLMNRYKEPFIAYMKELKNQDKKFNAEKDKELFQKHLGKKLSDLDTELDAYVANLASQIDEEEYLFFKHAGLRSLQQKKDFEDSVSNLHS